MSKITSIRSTAVVGTGTLGRQIATYLATQGQPVVLVKATGKDPSKARAAVEKSLQRRVSRGRLGAEEMQRILGRMEITADLQRIAGCDLVIESVIEELDAKRAMLARIAAVAPPDAILASNTSTLPLAELAPEGRESRFFALHFFSPVSKMKLVEIACLPGASADAAQILREFIEDLDKIAVEVGPTPGYVVNRLLVPQLLAAIRSFQQGLAPARSIDQAMKLGLGHPMGPLALCDLIGLDIVFDMSRTLYRELGDSTYKAPALLRRLVQDRALGKKTGLGFYDYSRSDGELVENPALAELIGRPLRALTTPPPQRDEDRRSPAHAQRPAAAGR